MTMRRRLANRRSHKTIEFVHPIATPTNAVTPQRYKIGFGQPVLCDGSCGANPRLGPVAEVFLKAQKVNSELDVLVNDGAIVMSMLLQYGCPPADIYHAMKRNPDGSLASPLGRAAAYLVESDR
jgi:hypothetical protein